MTEQQIVDQTRLLKEECIKNGFDWEIISQYLMTGEQYEDWYMNELSKYEASKDQPELNF